MQTNRWRRSSASPSCVINVRSAYPHLSLPARGFDVTRLPAMVKKPCILQKDAAQGHPDALSLAFLETSPLLPAIDELDTQPPAPGRGLQVPSSHLTGQARRRHLALLKPLDRLRWWLLYPGRIEFLLWLCGMFLLLGVTIILSLATTFSLGNFNAERPVAQMRSSESPTPLHCPPNGQQTNCATATASPPALKMVLFNESPMVIGMPVQLRGEGFSAYGRINFTCGEENHSCRPDSTLADEHGNFAVALIPGDKATWLAGSHRLVAYDVKTNRSVELTVIFEVL